MDFIIFLPPFSYQADFNLSKQIIGLFCSLYGEQDCVIVFSLRK